MRCASSLSRSWSLPSPARAASCAPLRLARAATKPSPGRPTPSARTQAHAAASLSRTLYDARLPPMVVSRRERLLCARGESERSLELWRSTCARAHAALSGPLRGDGKFRAMHASKTARVVAHSIRLLLRLGHHHAARELDRAFFSRDPAPDPTPYDPPPHLSKGTFDPEPWRLGRGVGLERGTVQLAWMQSLALRLLPGPYADPDGFAELLSELQTAHGRAGLTPVMVAFLVRKSAVYAARLAERPRRGAGGGVDDDDGAMERIDEFLLGVQRAPVARTRVVSLALVESQLLGLERRANEDGEAMAHVEDATRELVLELEDEGAPDSLEGFERRAQTLHLAVRFVLLRARQSGALVRPQERAAVLAESTVSAAALYEHLLALVPAAAAAAAARPILHAVRERQTGALYRLLWTAVGVTDPSGAKDDSRRELEHAVRTGKLALPAPDLASLSLAFTALESTLATLCTTLPSPAPQHAPFRDKGLVSLSPRYWRRLLLTLSFPACVALRADARPPWTVLKRALSLLRTTQSHDALRSPTGRAPNGGIFDRRALVLHVLRAVLIGGPKAGQGEETVEKRLEYFLGTLEQMRQQGEVVDRKMVVGAVEALLRAEWAGDAASGWRKRIMAVVHAQWVEFDPAAAAAAEAQAQAVLPVDEPLPTQPAVPDPTSASPTSSPPSDLPTAPPARPLARATAPAPAPRTPLASHHPHPEPPLAPSYDPHPAPSAVRARF